MAALAYPFWFAVFPLIYVTPDKRNDPFLRFHAYQGLLLGLVGVVGMSLLRAVLSFVVRWLILLDVLLYPLLRAGEYAVMFAMVYSAVFALLGKRAEIPFLSEFVRSLHAQTNSPELSHGESEEAK